MADVYAGGDVVAEVVRSGFTEGFHRGSVVVLDAAGAVVDSVGDVTSPVFPRSSNKPMQAVGMLRAGLRLPDAADLALVAGSHWGEPVHVARVRAMLRSGGLTEADLGTPADYPISVPARDDLLRAGGGPAPVYMNCSGKHAGMLLTCLAAGWPTRGYLAADHPLQVRLRRAVEDAVGQPIAAAGVDGCGAPVFACSLTALAGAYLRLVSAAPGSAERVVANAMRSAPELTGGPQAEDCQLMRGVPGLLAKVGAEGVLALAVPGVGAVALKIDDGAGRARPPVAVRALRALGVSAPVLDELAETPLLGGGVPVGAVRARY